MSRDTGLYTEQVAQRYLEQQGLTLCANNFSCRFGEIDLIMKNRASEIVFVEVRYRQSDDYGGALASITPQKQQKLIRTAQKYLQKHHCTDSICRFDVIAMSGSIQQPDIEWIQNAFGA